LPFRAPFQFTLSRRTNGFPPSLARVKKEKRRVLLHALARACPSRAPPAVPVSFRGRNARAGPASDQTGHELDQSLRRTALTFRSCAAAGQPLPARTLHGGGKREGGVLPALPGNSKASSPGGSGQSRRQMVRGRYTEQAGQRGLLRPHQALSLLLKNTRNVEQWNGTPFSLHKKRGIMEWNGMPFFHFWRWWVPLPISFFSRA
jgi:hypothetical protein